jgi:hypothetical protein
MPEWHSIEAFRRDFAKLVDDLTGPEKRKITKQMGAEAQQIAARQASQDLGGDRAFSGWTRNHPIPLDTRVRNAADFNVLMTPTRTSAGPWTVAELGRNTKAGPRLVGPRLTRTGRVSRARTKRYNGRTRGKGTATDAVKEMDAKLPDTVDRAVRATIRKRFDVT